jgi:hypothetical protein
LDKKSTADDPPDELNIEGDQPEEDRIFCDKDKTELKPPVNWGEA